MAAATTPGSERGEHITETKEKASPFTVGMNPTTPPQPPVLSPLTAYPLSSTTGKNWRLDWGPPGRRRLPYRSRGGVSEAVATQQAKSDPRPVVPAHRGVQGRQADGTARARTRGTPRLGHSCRLSETNGMHAARGYRVRTDAEYATSLAGPTSCARTRYRLAGPRSAGEKLPTGTRDWSAVPRWNPRASARGGCQTRRSDTRTDGGRRCPLRG
jgi:hypothetical protein